MVNCLAEGLQLFPAFALQFHILLWIAVGAAAARLVLSVFTIRHRVSMAEAKALNAWRVDASAAMREWEARNPP